MRSTVRLGANKTDRWAPAPVPPCRQPNFERDEIQAILETPGPFCVLSSVQASEAVEDLSSVLQELCARNIEEERRRR